MGERINKLENDIDIAQHENVHVNEVLFSNHYGLNLQHFIICIKIVFSY